MLHLDHGDPWVYGVLVNNIWSLTSDKQGGSYNNGLIQPFVNYNFQDGFYLTSAPILTVDWKADSGQQWTVPIGGGVGKIFHLGKLPVNTQISAYYNVVQARLRGELADPRAGATDVPQVNAMAACLNSARRNAGGLIGALVVGKWIAAEGAGRAFGYAPAARRTLWSLRCRSSQRRSRRRSSQPRPSMPPANRSSTGGF